MSDREWLANSLTRREPTHAVAKHIASLDLALPVSLGRQVSSLGRSREWYMNDDFDVVVPAQHQVDTFDTLFGIRSADPTSPQALRQLVADGMRYLGYGDEHPTAILAACTRLKTYAHKRVRFLRRLDEKADRLEANWRLRHAQMQAKSRLAYRIDADRCDDLTLACCAYWAARANRRSIFMVGSQSRAKDEIAEGLGALLADNERTDWYSVALIHPTKDVIEQLAAEERGRLLSTFHSEMAIAARELAKLWPTLPVRMRAEMVVVRGIDSSRWNAYAGALNTMRQAWISAVVASNLDAILESYLPGKTPRLMASDVAWMYRGHGMELHEDTRMFVRLESPWDVVNGVRTQGRAQVLAAAKLANVNATETGWIGPHKSIAAEAPTPEPALVHGVVVTDPELAETLKRCGVFSGKELKHLDELLAAPSIRRREIRDGDSILPYVEPADKSPLYGRI
jgi:hypothetical protein